jgi:hypothetical protein
MSETVYPDNLKISLPEPYLIAIGRVTVQWGALEAIVDLALRKLLAFDLYDSRAEMLTAHMTWPLKMDILGSLVDAYRDEHPHLEQFDQVSSLLKSAQKGRNKVAHAKWDYTDGAAHILRATARGKLKTSIDKITVDDLNHIVDEIGAAGAALLKMILNK